jgi:hypothetical protein
VIGNVCYLYTVKGPSFGEIAAELGLLKSTVFEGLGNV